MLDQTGTVLYVGKARHLKKRVASYFSQSATISPKTRALVAQIATIEVTVTHTEGEALLLENNLIKSLQPRYNILLRDDKSYPYLYLSDQPFPRLSWHRGTKRGKGRYFGPYPHASAVYESLSLLQQLFLLRTCEESVFRNRSRPCLQYQIKRCTAPCVGLIDAASYQEEVQHAGLFLEGKNQAVIDILVEKMQTAATALDFEKAAAYRDQIKSLRTIQERQYVSSIEGGNVDIVVAVSDKGIGCVQVLMVRDGRQLGNRAFFPDLPPISPLTQEGELTLAEEETAEIISLLAAFLPQYYLAADHEIPEEIIVNQAVGEELTILAEVLSTQSGKSVTVHSRVRGTRARWVEMAVANAKASLKQRIPSQYRERLDVLRLVLKLEKLPQRIECFDVSHTFGEATVASCVVFDADGPCHSDYRRFNIENITPGDDYAALRQALTRHYRKFVSRTEATATSDSLSGPLKEPNRPEILLIDGGIGQVRVAQQVLADLRLQGIRIIGVAKGPGRKPGLETLILSADESSLTLPKNSPALHLIQQLRDEAHRFAIMAHRGQRAKIRRTSILEEIAGIGPTRRQSLLRHFGGLEGISRAGIEDLTTVPGISRALAHSIYEFFNARRG